LTLFCARYSGVQHAASAVTVGSGDQQRMSMLAELIGGAQGGMMGALASHPFDVCSVAVMRGEASNGFAALVKRVRTEGPLGLWRGAPMNALFNIVNKSVYFLAYAWYTALYKRRMQSESVASAANIAIGWLAQMSAVPFFAPFYTVFLRSLQPQFQGRPPMSIARELVKEGGTARLYQGASSWLGYSLRPAIEITVYDQIKFRLVPAGANLGGFQAFFLGALGRAIGTAIVFPVTFAMKTVATGKYKSPLEAWSVTIKEKGVLALWKGLGAEIPRGIGEQSAHAALACLLCMHWFYRLLLWFKHREQDSVLNRAGWLVSFTHAPPRSNERHDDGDTRDVSAVQRAMVGITRSPRMPNGASVGVEYIHD
jgi:hypothetical protein